MNYQQLLTKIENYKNKYNVKVIGQTSLGRKIYAVEKCVDKNFSTAIFVASVHAREYVATDLLCKFLDDGLFDNIKNFNITFILMANPDGVELCYYGLSSVCDEIIRHNLLVANSGNLDFSLWKANANGVDINNNFDAKFGHNAHKNMPASQGYIGKFAESENETKALVEYAKSKNIFFTISYHTKGEEIYYNFFQSSKHLERDEQIAQKFAQSTGYLIKNVESVSSGGFKDWCVQKLKIPALTIELASDSLVHPIGEQYLEDIFERNKNVAFDLEYAYNIFKKYE